MFPRQASFSPKRIPRHINLACDSRGLSMLEVIIAFVILQVSIVAFAQFFTAALDISRSARRTEMAQMLGQAKMEELMRLLPVQEPLDFPEGTAKVLNERPGTFDEYASANPEDITPFSWIAEANLSPTNSKLVDFTLHIYSVRKRTKESESPKEEFYVSDNRKTFTFVHTLADGSTEFMHGKEELRLSSAVALP
ncbi:MAG: hypothetical protein HY801_00170 [Candidatus Lindowbacteria bacterium]|nr:hypothetical protein [Candidatus Lindowbacteria bacterium]